ncbi:MFS transporter [Telmatospirillum siberiense]|uniref:MFS transporter n=1 Tax=Telmatospirillum siberiense TaxID=382514 RepID=UPI001F53308C|nr:MFS transporter [Telmatospirillum siberiense]
MGGLIFVIYTVAAADRANLGVALPFIRQEFHMTNTEAGALSSLFLFAYAIAQIPSGFAYSKFRVRKIFSFSMIMTSLFTGMIGTVGSALMLKICRFGLGLAEGPLPVGITSTINNWFPPQEKGTATGLFLAAVKFGPVIVPPVCSVVIMMFGWREIFFVFSLPGLLLSVAWYFLVTNHPSESPHCSASELAFITETARKETTQDVRHSSPTRSLAWLDKLIRSRPVTLLDDTNEVFASWDIWGSTLGYFFMIGIVNVLLAWIPTYLMTVKHFSVMNMGLVAAAPWIGAVIGNIVGGFISDKVIDKRRKPNMMITALSTTIMMYGLVHAPNDPYLLGGLLFVTGILLNLGFSAYMVYPMGLTTKKAYPIACSIVNTGGQLGGACMALLTGIILDRYGWDEVWLFLSACSFTTFLLLLTISEPRPHINTGS